MDPSTDHVRLGRDLLEAGELQRAADALEGVVHSLEEGSELESGALHALALAYGRLGRFFEAAVVARRLASRRRAVGDEAGLRGALAILVGALINSTAYVRAMPHLAQLEALLAGVEPVDEPMVHRMVHNARYSVALTEGDFVAARDRLDRMKAMLRSGVLPPEEAWYLKNAEFHLAAHEADIPAMEQLLSEIVDADHERNVYVPEVTVRVGLAQVYARAGRLEDARRIGAEIVTYLQTAERASDLVVGDGAQLVRLFADTLDEPDLAARTAREISAGMLERLRLLGASARTLKGLADPEDEAFLSDTRNDFMSSLLDFLRGIRSMMRPQGGAPDSDGLTIICAWCGAIHVVDGGWVPLQEYVPELPVSEVTHGICPPCFDTTLSQR